MRQPVKDVNYSWPANSWAEQLKKRLWTVHWKQETNATIQDVQLRLESQISSYTYSKSQLAVWYYNRRNANMATYAYLCTLQWTEVTKALAHRTVSRSCRPRLWKAQPAQLELLQWGPLCDHGEHSMHSTGRRAKLNHRRQRSVFRMPASKVMRFLPFNIFFDTRYVRYATICIWTRDSRWIRGQRVNAFFDFCMK